MHWLVVEFNFWHCVSKHPRRLNPQRSFDLVRTPYYKNHVHSRCLDETVLLASSVRRRGRASAAAPSSPGDAWRCSSSFQFSKTYASKHDQQEGGEPSSTLKYSCVACSPAAAVIVSSCGHTLNAVQHEGHATGLATTAVVGHTDTNEMKCHPLPQTARAIFVPPRLFSVDLIISLSYIYVLLCTYVTKTDSGTVPVRTPLWQPASRLGGACLHA